MKLLLFAHTPPPDHGQSRMVQLLLAGLGGEARSRPAGAPPPPIECHHVNARLSDDLADIGRVRPGKLLRLVRHCCASIGIRWRFGADHFLYVPAPPRDSALLRDWLVMLLCRPFFRRRILWWQAAGLGAWLESAAPAWKRWLTRRLLGGADLSIVLSEWGRGDAERLASRSIVVVSNGIPDPCPDFNTEVLPRRLARATARRQWAANALTTSAGAAAGGGSANRYRLLFLGLCTREKGLFEAVQAVSIANRQLSEMPPALQVELTVAGEFRDAAEREEFDRILASPHLRDAGGRPLVRHVGFVDGDRKADLLRDCDCLCFPTYYEAESFGIVLIEAMAWGLDIITTRWRAIPEILPAGFDGYVAARSPAEIAEQLVRRIPREPSPALRHHFIAHFTAEKCVAAIQRALLELDAR